MNATEIKIIGRITGESSITKVLIWVSTDEPKLEGNYDDLPVRKLYRAKRIEKKGMDNLKNLKTNKEK